MPLPLLRIVPFRLFIIFTWEIPETSGIFLDGRACHHSGHIRPVVGRWRRSTVFKFPSWKHLRATANGTSRGCVCSWNKSCRSTELWTTTNSSRALVPRHRKSCDLECMMTARTRRSLSSTTRGSRSGVHDGVRMAGGPFILRKRPRHRLINDQIIHRVSEAKVLGVLFAQRLGKPIHYSYFRHRSDAHTIRRNWVSRDFLHIRPVVAQRCT
jgi:hypothetical protein